MSGLPPYNSSPEAKELWEITGALAEEDRLRAGNLYCSECRHCDDPDRPWSCSKLCPNRKGELFMIMLGMEENWFWFWYHIEAEHSNKKGCIREWFKQNTDGKLPVSIVSASLRRSQE